MRDDTAKLLSNLGRPDFPYRDFGEDHDANFDWPLVEAVLAAIAPTPNATRGERHQAEFYPSPKRRTSPKSRSNNLFDDRSSDEVDLASLYDTPSAEPVEQGPATVADFLKDLSR